MGLKYYIDPVVPDPFTESLMNKTELAIINERKVNFKY
jgi:hypothetical protein